MAAPRGSKQNPMRIADVEKGDLSDDPIIVDDYDWDANFLDVESANELDSDSSNSDSDTTDTECQESQERSRLNGKEDVLLVYHRTLASSSKGQAVQSSESKADSDCESGNNDAAPDTRELSSPQGNKRICRLNPNPKHLKFQSWKGKERSSGGSPSRSVLKPANEESSDSSSGYRKGTSRSQYYEEARCLRTSGHKRNGPAILVFGRPITPRSKQRKTPNESPFVIPSGEGLLWRELSMQAEEIMDERAVEQYLFDKCQQPENHCRPTDTVSAPPTNLPLEIFIGDFTLERHAEIEPQSVDFRRDIIRRELKHRDRLRIAGEACAQEMMKKLGVHVPVDATGLEVDSGTCLD